MDTLENTANIGHKTQNEDKQNKKHNTETKWISNTDLTKKH
jgi:hypothetical protein